jgi:hypothetical protein
MEARIDPHPPADSLKAFGLGLLDDTSAYALFLHLEGCAPCRRAEEASGDDFLDRLQMGIPTSPDTLLRPMGQSAMKDAPPPRLLGVDDWAIRRG